MPSKLKRQRAVRSEYNRAQSPVSYRQGKALPRALNCNRGLSKALPASLLALTLLLSSVVSAQTTITVDPHSVFQTFEGWGTSLCWWANMAGKFSPPTRMRMAQDLFTLNNGGLGLTIVRFNAGGGENPALPNTMELRARMDGYWPGPDQSYNWHADQTQRAILGDAIEAARAAGLRPSFEVFAHSPPCRRTP